MNAIWNVKERGNKQDVERIVEDLNVDWVIANLLVQRGITTYDEAEKFFRPKLSELNDPFLMKDMQAAVERLQSAIANNEKILVFGDYDVDGTTAVAMVYSFLIGKTTDVIYYIPDRYTEGYGLSMKGIDYAFEQGCKLIIALDCGIKAVEKIEYANTLDVDIIICDHHNPGQVLPEAVAILDPKREDCDYPYKELSGCGVGFKLLQAYTIAEKYELIPESHVAKELLPYLDLVAVSIASDIVPITQENRIMAFYGLKQINEAPRTGLKAIIEIAGIDRKEVEINDIVFKIGPRINAAGRIESGQRSVDLLTSSDYETALSIAAEVNEMNSTRQDFDQKITEEAVNYLHNNPELHHKKTTVVFNKDWHKGVVGIVASRLIEHYYRPTIVLTESNGIATGSARSVPGYDIYKAIEACSDILESFGGHSFAAGLSMKLENVKLFQDKFEQYVSETIKPEMLVQQIDIDAYLKLNDISPRFYRVLKQFSPFGPNNMKPVFATRNVIDSGRGKPVGKEGDHLRLDVKEHIAAHKSFPAIAFKQARHFDAIKYKKPFDICYSVEENEFMGNVSLQIKIRDIKPIEEY